MKKRAKILGLVLAVAISLTACGTNANRKVLVKVNGESIYFDVAKFLVYNTESMYQQYEALYQQSGGSMWDQPGSEDGETLRDMAKRETMDEIVRYEICRQKAEEAGMTLTEEDIDNNTKTVESFFSQVSKESLDLIDVSEENLLTYYNGLILSQKYIQDYLSTMDLGEKADTIKKAEYRQYDTQHILFSTLSEEVDESGQQVEVSASEQQKIKREAERVLERAKDGESFDELVKEFSEDTPESVSNGGIYSFSVNNEDSTTPEYVKAAKKLKNGEISGLVKTPFGYHIIKMNNNQSETAYNEAINNLKYQEFVAVDSEKMKEEAEVKIYSEVWDPVVMGETTIKPTESDAEGTGTEGTDEADDTNTTDE